MEMERRGVKWTILNVIEMLKRRVMLRRKYSERVTAQSESRESKKAVGAALT
jgi:hypothetical protein